MQHKTYMLRGLKYGVKGKIKHLIRAKGNQGLMIISIIIIPYEDRRIEVKLLFARTDNIQI